MARLPSRAGAIRWLGPALLLGAVWALAIRQLSLEWSINPEYQYGWIVPVLAGFLWWRAWRRRPAADERPSVPLLPGVVVLLALVAVPVRIIEEANPDWRLLNYYFAGQAIVVTALVIQASGGRGWLRHFAFPLLFPLIAVPWPSGPETVLIQGLQRCIAAIGVEAASWLGWSASQSGNLIILPNGIVGISEACSGIRSLQSSLMIALFLGEFFGLAVLYRWVLIGVALASAFLLNAIRAFFLMTVMDWHGMEATLRFHDPAGLTIALGSLILLWITANLLAPRVSVPEQQAPVSAGSLRFPQGWLTLLLVAWLGAELVNQAWYLSHEGRMKAAPVWTLHWPPPRDNFKAMPIDDEVRSYLRYDQGVHGRWQDKGDWEVFYFMWKPGRASTGLAQSHRPDICMPAAGFIMLEDSGTEPMDINGLRLPVHRYVFRDYRGSLYYVFQAVTDDRVAGDDTTSPVLHGRFDRLETALAGRRNPGQRSLLMVNQGAPNMAEAEARLRDQLKDLLMIEPASGS